MNVLVVNENKSSNLGDQAIYSGLLSILKEKNCNVESWDLSCRGSVEQVSAVKSIKKIEFPLFLLRIINVLRSLWIIIKNLKLISKHIKNNELIVFGGGSLLIDNNLSFPSKLFLYAFLIKRFKKKYIVIGCSARPVKSRIADFMLNYFVSGADKVGLRDVYSIKLFESKVDKCYFTPDTALYLPQLLERKKTKLEQGIRKKIGINIMSSQKHGFFSEHKNYKTYIEIMGKLIESLQGYEVIIFTTGDLGDNEFVTQHFSSRENVFIPDSLDSLLLFLSGMDKVFTTRLHASILAITQGVVPYVFSWDDKVTGFVETFEMNEYYMDLRVHNGLLPKVFDYISGDVFEQKKILYRINNETKKNFDLFLGSVC